MKKIFNTILLLLCWVGTIYSQMVINDGASFVVESGTEVIIHDGIIADNGTIKNEGTIHNLGDLINNSSTLFTSNSTGTFVFDGSSRQEISGNNDIGFYGTLEIDNAAGVSISDVSTGVNQTVNGILHFTDGILLLNEFDLFVGSADPSGITASRYIKTNGTGSVEREVPADGTTLVLFPVGNSSYNPMILINSGTATGDNYGVRAIDNEPANANTPHLVNRSWQITEETSGGSELTATPQWIGSQELTDFNRDNSSVGRTVDGGANYEWKQHGPSVGSDPFTQTGSVFTEVGTFTIGDYYYSIPNEISIAGTTISDLESDCFDAKQTIIVAGDGSTVEVLAGGDATFVAGQTIYLRYGFTSAEGSYTHAYITLNNEFCGSQPAPLVASQQAPLEEVLHIPDQISNSDGLSIHIYPNPTSGRFKIDFSNFTETADVHVMNFQGQEVLNTSNMNQLTMELNISKLPKGIYMVIVESADQIISGKVIKN